MPAIPVVRSIRDHRFLPAVAALVLAVAAWAGAARAADVPFPMIPEAAKGTACVEDTDFMRRNHMRLLTHQRDDTLRRGIRTTKYSLQGCIDCHAVKDDAGRFVSHEDPRHFCVACHEYAAVQPDCFQCHSSVPEGSDGASAGRQAKR